MGRMRNGTFIHCMAVGMAAILLSLVPAGNAHSATVPDATSTGISDASLKLYFFQDYSTYDSLFMDNGRRLDEFVRQYGLTDPDGPRISVAGSASAEGPYIHNEDLSLRRATRICDILVNSYGVPSYRIDRDARGIDWDDLLQQVRTASGLSQREAPVTNASIYSMGVFAGYTLDASFGDDTRSNDYIDNSMYYYVAAEDIWKWNFPTYWPMVGCLSIFAYSPYDPTLRLLDNTGFPSFSYSPLTDVRHQVDFCVAEPELNRTKTAGAIPVYFRHTMAGIMISMNYTGTLPSADYYVKIDRIELGGIIGTKVLAFLPDGDGGSGGHDNPHFRWEDDDEAAKTASYELKRTKDVTETQIIDVELPKKDDGNTNHIQVNPDGGALYLLPQTADKATISITYGYYKANGTSETMMMRFESTAELPSAAWEAGRYTRYRMTLDIGHASILHLVAESGETMIEKYADAKDPATLVDRKVE